MIPPLRPLLDEFDAIERQLADPGVAADAGLARRLAQRHGALREAVDLARAVLREQARAEDARAALDDPLLGELARNELRDATARIDELAAALREALVPDDPEDDKDVILEVRAAAGGGEAALFAGELLQAYRRYAASAGLRTEMLDSQATDLGGFAKASLEVTGPGAYRRLKYEAGVHRVQRVPVTEAQGRIHTSTVTVAVMPAAAEVDVHLDPADVRVDVYRSSGPGGQSVNTTDSAVRVTYRPGTAEELVVTCQDGKSQIKNKEKALAVLRARLLEREREAAGRASREARLVQIGGGERSEKIRTYNFPQSRVTDHRIGFTSHDLTGILAGDFGELHEALERVDRGRRAEALARTWEGDPRGAA